MEVKIWLILIAAIAGSIAYRLGGKAGYNTKIRDLGLPLITLPLIWFLADSELKTAFPLRIGLFLAVFGLMFASLTTYYDSIFGQDNFYAHGAGIGLSLLPLIWCGIPWYGILGRTIFLALSFGLLNRYINKYQVKRSDDIEEYSRGALIILTIPLLLI